MNNEDHTFETQQTDEKSYLDKVTEILMNYSFYWSYRLCPNNNNEDDDVMNDLFEPTVYNIVLEYE